MARPRRARRRTGRVVLVVAAAVAATLAVTSFAIWRVAADATSSHERSADPTTEAVPSGGQPASPTVAAAPSPSQVTSGSGSAAELRAVVAACAAVVRGRDRVIAEATVGVGHWAQHVQAQTDANAKKISAAKMKKIFTKTRLAGPADLRRYDRALRAATAQRGSCAAPKDASAEVAQALSSCSARLRAQGHVLDAATLAMADWGSHQAAMRRSRMGHVHDAQEVWLRAWRAAPPHITSYQSAVATFRAAPAC